MADDESFDLSGDLDLDDSILDDSSPLDVETDLTSDSSSVSGIDSVDAEAEVEADTSADQADAETDDAFVAPKRKSLLTDFSLFDAMLVCSLLLVTMAALIMVSGLSDYGGFFGLPWKTGGITVK